MSKKAKLLLLTLTTILLTACNGCTVGLKEKHSMLFVSPVPIPEAAKGAPVVATNQKVKLSVLNRPDEIYEQKVTGYVLVDPWFYEKLVEAYKKSK